MKYRFLVLAVFFLPIISHAEVIFSEIAWMGTETDANDEWIEIYNFSSTPVNLAGWTLTDGDSLNIPLSGFMTPHAVFVLERTDDSTLPDVTADIIYTGALSNSGATLMIKDAGGAVINEVVGGSDWENIGGHNELKYTAQRTRTGSWVTAEPTPGLPNAEEDAELPEPDSQPVSSGGGGGPVQKVIRDRVIEENIGLTLEVDAPSVVHVNEEVKFNIIPEGVGKTTKNSLKYFWNFGDLITSENKTPTHVFSEPGEYLVVVEGSYKTQIAQARQVVKVVPATIKVSLTDNGNIMITNESAKEFDLGNLALRGNRSLTFPRLTIIAPNGSMTVPREKVGYAANTRLLDQNNSVLASLHHPPQGSVLGVKKIWTNPVTPTQIDSVSDEEEKASASFGKESIADQNSNMITIGATEKTTESGFLSRVFRKVGSLFRL